MPISHNCAMKRILFVVDDLGKGGAQNITLQLAIYLSNDHEVHVAVMNDKKNILSPPHPIIYHDLKIRPEIAFGKLWKPKSLSIVEQTTLRLLADLDFDIVRIKDMNEGYKIVPNNAITAFWTSGILIDSEEEIKPYMRITYEGVTYWFDEKQKKLKFK